MNREDAGLWQFAVGLIVGGLGSLLVFLPALHAEMERTADARAGIGIMVRSCAIFVDGSAQCPARTFPVPMFGTSSTTTTTSVAK